MTHSKYQKSTGSVHGISECLLLSLSNVTSCIFLIACRVLAQGTALPPSPAPAQALYSFSESLNGDHVSCHPNVWSELAFEDCHDDLC